MRRQENGLDTHHRMPAAAFDPNQPIVASTKFLAIQGVHVDV